MWLGVGGESLLRGDGLPKMVEVFSAGVVGDETGAPGFNGACDEDEPIHEA